MGELFSHSGILFSRPSFIEGMSRVYDLGGAWDYYNVSPSGSAADYYAFYNDWKAIGDSIRSSAESLTTNNSTLKLSLKEYVK